MASIYCTCTEALLSDPNLPLLLLRSPTDAVLERNDATFIAEIRDAVINEVEVETQSANAYAIWTEKPEEVCMCVCMYVRTYVCVCLSICFLLLCMYTCTCML